MVDWLIDRWKLTIVNEIVSNVFQALPYVMLLIAMLFFIYAIIGMQVSSLPSSINVNININVAQRPHKVRILFLKKQDNWCFVVTLNIVRLLLFYKISKEMFFCKIKGIAKKNEMKIKMKWRQLKRRGTYSMQYFV